MISAPDEWLVWIREYLLQLFVILPVGICLSAGILGGLHLRGLFLGYLLPSLAAGLMLGAVTVLRFPSWTSSGKLVFLPPAVLFLYGLIILRDYSALFDPTSDHEGGIGIVLFTAPAVAYTSYSLTVFALDLVLVKWFDNDRKNP